MCGCCCAVIYCYCVLYRQSDLLNAPTSKSSSNMTMSASSETKTTMAMWNQWLCRAYCIRPRHLFVCGCLCFLCGCFCVCVGVGWVCICVCVCEQVIKNNGKQFGWVVLNLRAAINTFHCLSFINTHHHTIMYTHTGCVWELLPCLSENQHWRGGFPSLANTL